MSESQGIEYLQKIVDEEGFPKLFVDLYELLSNKQLLPKLRSPKGSNEAQAFGTSSTQWQPLGIQVVHTLFSLCLYPDSDSQLEPSKPDRIPDLPPVAQTLPDAVHQGFANKSNQYENKWSTLKSLHKIGVWSPPRKESRSQSLGDISETDVAQTNPDTVHQGLADKSSEDMNIRYRPQSFQNFDIGTPSRNKSRSQSLGNISEEGGGHLQVTLERKDTKLQTSEKNLNSAREVLEVQSAQSSLSRQRSRMKSRTARMLEMHVRVSEDQVRPRRRSPTHNSAEYSAESLESDSDNHPEIKPSKPLQKQLSIMGERKLVRQNSLLSKVFTFQPRSKKFSVISNNSGTFYAGLNGTSPMCKSSDDGTPRRSPFDLKRFSADGRISSSEYEMEDINDANLEERSEHECDDASECTEGTGYLISPRIRRQKSSRSSAKEIVANQKHVANLSEKVLQEAEEQIHTREKPPRWWLIHPQSFGHGLWDGFMAVNLLYILAFTPIQASFDSDVFHQPAWEWVEVVVSLSYGMDIIVNFATGVYISLNKPSKNHPRRDRFDGDDLKVNEKRLSYSLRDISLRYLKGWFVVDVISTLPWDFILHRFLDSSTTLNVGTLPKLLKLIRLARLMKLLRLHRLRSVAKVMERSIGSSGMELIKMFVGVCVLCHYVACGFFFIAVLRDENGAGTWLEYYLESPNAVQQFPDRALYLNSVYWSFATVTSVGYGDVLPITTSEKVYASLVMYCGVAVMAVITGKLASIFEAFDAPTAAIESKLQSVKMYCKYRDLPLKLQQRVVQYVDVKARTNRICNEEEILSDMSPYLKAQVVCYVFQEVIQSVPFFHGCSDLFLSAVLGCMTPVLFAPADILIQQGQRELAMFVLTKGRAVVVSPIGRVIKELNSGTSIGEIGLFFGVRRTATVCSITFCDTFKLMQDKFVKVQEMYPDMQALIDDQAETMFKEGISCYICGKAGHVSVQCTDPKAQELGVYPQLSSRSGKTLLAERTETPASFRWLGTSRAPSGYEEHDEGSDSPTIRDLAAADELCVDLEESRSRKCSDTTSDFRIDK